MREEIIKKAEEILGQEDVPEEVIEDDQGWVEETISGRFKVIPDSFKPRTQLRITDLETGIDVIIPISDYEVVRNILSALFMGEM